MDLIVLLAWIGAIGGGITIWRSIKRSHKDTENDAHGWDLAARYLEFLEVTPEGVDADALRQVILERFDLSLGTGLGKMQGKLFRIGHLGDINELTLAGALAGIEMGLKLAGVPHRAGGMAAALDYLSDTA